LSQNVGNLEATGQRWEMWDVGHAFFRGCGYRQGLLYQEVGMRKELRDMDFNSGV
jgi:hypothetical protein